MDNKKRIRDLTNTSTAPENTDFLVLDNGTTNKITRANLLAGTPLPANTVDTQAIENDAVTTNKILDANVTNAKLATNAVSEVKILNGAVTDDKWRNGAAFSATPNETQTILDTTFTKLNLKTVNYDIGNNYDADNSRFTAPYTGVYSFNGAVTVNGLPSGTEFFCSLYRNGGEVKRGTRIINGAGTIDGVGVVTSDLLLSAGQYVELYVRHNTGGTRTTPSSGASVYFSGHLVTRT